MDERRRSEMESLGVALVELAVDDGGRLPLEQVLRRLPVGLAHLLVEPGPTLAGSFLSEGLADRVWVIESPKVLDENGAVDAPELDEGSYPPAGSVELEGDVLREHLNRRSPVYAATEPSADLVLLG